MDCSQSQKLGSGITVYQSSNKYSTEGESHMSDTEEEVDDVGSAQKVKAQSLPGY